jgi:hypothetical protein
MGSSCSKVDETTDPNLSSKGVSRPGEIRFASTNQELMYRYEDGLQGIPRSLAAAGHPPHVQDNRASQRRNTGRLPLGRIESQKEPRATLQRTRRDLSANREKTTPGEVRSAPDKGRRAQGTSKPLSSSPPAITNLSGRSSAATKRGSVKSKNRSLTPSPANSGGGNNREANDDPALSPVAPPDPYIYDLTLRSLAYTVQYEKDALQHLDRGDYSSSSNRSFQSMQADKKPHLQRAKMENSLVSYQPTGQHHLMYRSTTTSERPNQTCSDADGPAPAIAPSNACHRKSHLQQTKDLTRSSNALHSVVGGVLVGNLKAHQNQGQAVKPTETEVFGSGVLASRRKLRLFRGNGAKNGTHKLLVGATGCGTPTTNAKSRYTTSNNYPGQYPLSHTTHVSGAGAPHPEDSSESSSSSCYWVMQDAVRYERLDERFSSRRVGDTSARSHYGGLVGDEPHRKETAPDFQLRTRIVMRRQSPQWTDEHASETHLYAIRYPAQIRLDPKGREIGNGTGHTVVGVEQCPSQLAPALPPPNSANSKQRRLARNDIYSGDKVLTDPISYGTSVRSSRGARRADGRQQAASSHFPTPVNIPLLPTPAHRPNLKPNVSDTIDVDSLFTPSAMNETPKRQGKVEVSAWGSPCQQKAPCSVAQRPTPLFVFFFFWSK